MAQAIKSLTGRPAWKALEAHFDKVRDLHLRKLFADDRERGDRFGIEDVGLYLDYSKNRITSETISLLLQLADECGLRAKIDALFRREKINITDNRAVQRVAMRAPKGTSSIADGYGAVPADPAVRHNIVA